MPLDEVFRSTDENLQSCSCLVGRPFNGKSGRRWKIGSGHVFVTGCICHHDGEGVCGIQCRSCRSRPQVGLRDVKSRSGCRLLNSTTQTSLNHVLEARKLQPPRQCSLGTLVGTGSLRSVHSAWSGGDLGCEHLKAQDTQGPRPSIAAAAGEEHHESSRSRQEERK